MEEESTKPDIRSMVIPDDLWEIAREISISERLSISSYIRRLIKADHEKRLELTGAS